MIDDVLVFRAAGRLYGFSLDVVLEVMRPLPVEPVADAPKYVLGIAMVRGRATPVLDASALLTGAGCGQSGRWLRLRARPKGDASNELKWVAAAVDDVVGIRRRDELELERTAPLLGEADAGLLLELGRLDGELLRVLQTGVSLSAEA
jgi:purine-binding chemotaxis protein CheW